MRTINSKAFSVSFIAYSALLVCASGDIYSHASSDRDDPVNADIALFAEKSDFAFTWPSSGYSIAPIAVLKGVNVGQRVDVRSAYPPAFLCAAKYYLVFLNESDGAFTPAGSIVPTNINCSRYGRLKTSGDMANFLSALMTAETNSDALLVQSFLAPNLPAPSTISVWNQLKTRKTLSLEDWLACIMTGMYATGASTFDWAKRNPPSNNSTNADSPQLILDYAYGYINNWIESNDVSKEHEAILSFIFSEPSRFRGKELSRFSNKVKQGDFLPLVRRLKTETDPEVVYSIIHCLHDSGRLDFSVPTFEIFVQNQEFYLGEIRQAIDAKRKMSPSIFENAVK